jgi:hypothetical protein
MKILAQGSVLAIAAVLICSVSLSAQQTTVKVRVETEGKVVTDTTYEFDDPGQAKQAMELLELMSGDEDHMVKVRKEVVEHHGDQASKNVIVHVDGDSLVWEDEGGMHFHGEHVVVMKTGDDDSYEFLISDDPGCEKKHVKVIVTEGDEGEWTIISEDDEDVRLEKGLEENDDADEVKVIVIKKKDKEEVKEKSKKQ